MTQTVSRTDVDRSLQDKAYDLLGDMLVERDTAKYMHALKMDKDNGCTAEMEAFFARQDKENLRKIQVYSRKQQNRRFLRHALPRLAQAVAVLITVITIAGGVALATSHTVRVQVMQLLLSVEKEYTELSLVEDEEASFDVPADWQGDSFLMYIPEGMRVEQCLTSNDDYYIMYRGTDDRTTKLSFSESGAEVVTNIDTENAAIRTLMIRDNLGYISVKNDVVQVFWSDGTHYFIVCTEKLGEEITIQIAQSVRSIF